jgi:hypothetical protein
VLDEGFESSDQRLHEFGPLQPWSGRNRLHGSVSRLFAGVRHVRATIETHDNALIYIAYTGVGDLGEDGYQKFFQGELPRALPLRVVPRFHTAHPAYQWLNRLQCLNIGEVDLERFEVRYDVYAIQ